MTRRRSDRVAKAASALALAAENYGAAVGDEVADIVASDQLEALKQQSERDDLVLLRIEACETKLYAEMAGIREELQAGVLEMRQSFETVVEQQFVKRQKLDGLSAQLRTILERLDAAVKAQEPPSREDIDQAFHIVAQVREAVTA